MALWVKVYGVVGRSEDRGEGIRKGMPTDHLSKQNSQVSKESQSIKGRSKMAHRSGYQK